MTAWLYLYAVSTVSFWLYVIFLLRSIYVARLKTHAQDVADAVAARRLRRQRNLETLATNTQRIYSKKFGESGFFQKFNDFRSRLRDNDA